MSSLWIALACTLPILALVARAAWLGFADGDRPGEPNSRLDYNSDGEPLLVVHNPGDFIVVVGLSWHCGRARPRLLRCLTPVAVFRTGRRSEYRRIDRGAVTVLGVVPPTSERRWALQPPTDALLCRVVIGCSPARLRITDYHSDLSTASKEAMPVRRPLW